MRRCSTLYLSNIKNINKRPVKLTRRILGVLSALMAERWLWRLDWVYKLDGFHVWKVAHPSCIAIPVVRWPLWNAFRKSLNGGYERTFSTSKGIQHLLVANPASEDVDEDLAVLLPSPHAGEHGGSFAVLCQLFVRLSLLVPVVDRCESSTFSLANGMPPAAADPLIAS